MSIIGSLFQPPGTAFLGLKSAQVSFSIKPALTVSNAFASKVVRSTSPTSKISRVAKFAMVGLGLALVGVYSNIFEEVANSVQSASQQAPLEQTNFCSSALNCVSPTEVTVTKEVPLGDVSTEYKLALEFVVGYAADEATQRASRPSGSSSSGSSSTSSHPSNTDSAHSSGRGRSNLPIQRSNSNGNNGGDEHGNTETGNEAAQRSGNKFGSFFQKYLAYDEPPPPPPPGSSSGNEEQDYPSYPNEITLLPILLLLILLGLYTDLRRTSAPEASTDAPKNTTRERRQIRIPEIQHATPHGHLQALTTIYNPLEGLLGNYITTLKDEVVIHPDIQLFDVGEILPCPEGFVKLYFEDTPYCDNIHREHPPSYYEPMTFRKKFDYVFHANGRLLDRWLQHVYIFEGLPWFVSFLIMATRVAWEMFITRGRAVECCDENFDASINPLAVVLSSSSANYQPTTDNSTDTLIDSDLDAISSRSTFDSNSPKILQTFPVLDPLVLNLAEFGSPVASSTSPDLAKNLTSDSSRSDYVFSSSHAVNENATVEDEDDFHDASEILEGEDRHAVTQEIDVVDCIEPIEDNDVEYWGVVKDILYTIEEEVEDPISQSSSKNSLSPLNPNAAPFVPRSNMIPHAGLSSSSPHHASSSRTSTLEDDGEKKYRRRRKHKSQIKRERAAAAAAMANAQN